MTQLISRTDLAALVERGAVTVVDALPAPYYELRHLPGAINLVAEDVDALAPGLLPDRSAPIVTYCSGATCPNSQLVATRLERLGYTNVRKYRDGIQDWVEAGLPTETGVHV
jgi:rhodanese-related sulfurtransferase